MKDYFSFWKFLTIFLVFTLYSCEEGFLDNDQENIIEENHSCKPLFKFDKKFYLSKDPLLKRINYKIDSIDLIISTKKTDQKDNTKNKFDDFILYSLHQQKLKLLSEIYIKDLKLAATKHEIYFIDSCNIISKMTKYAYRSKRIKSVFYFLFCDNQYQGCVVYHHHSMFHKKDRWINISDEKIAINWSKRIYDNMIKRHLYDF